MPIHKTLFWTGFTSVGILFFASLLDAKSCVSAARQAPPHLLADVRLETNKTAIGRKAYRRTRLSGSPHEVRHENSGILTLGGVRVEAGRLSPRIPARAN